MSETWSDDSAVPIGVIVRHAGERTSLDGIVAGKRFAREKLESTLMREGEQETVRLWAGFTLALKPHQADDYAVNLGGGAPQVYVSFRVDPDGWMPLKATVGPGEIQDLRAEEHTDGSHRILSAPMPPEVLRWVEDFTSRHYEPRKRRKGPGVRRTGDYETSVGLRQGPPRGRRGRRTDE